MYNCESCRDRDWCSSEEMDRYECPVKHEGDSLNDAITINEEDITLIYTMGG